jgi:septal ring factor EnvC (AmiA/AmiB activator)
MGRRTGIFIIAVIAALAWHIPAYSQNTRTQEARRARLQKEIAILDEQIRANSAKSANAMSRLTLISGKVDSRKRLIEESDREISEYSDSIARKEKEISVIKARLDTLSAHYAKLVRGAYINRSPKVWYMYILASDNIGQAFRRYGYLRDLSRQMNVQASKIIDIREELEKESAKLTAMKRGAEAVRAQRVSEMNKLKAEEDEARSLVSQLKKNKRKYQSDLSRKQREVEALNREIERIIRSATEGTGKSGKGGSQTVTRKPIDYTLAKKFEANKGKLPWPADGPVVDHFGQRFHPVYTNLKLPFNNGVTIALPAGTEIKAVFDGVVKQIVVMPGYNKCILVQHGNYFSFYCKLGTVSVKAGDKVKTGQVVGTVDTIGGETQLHFQIWSGRTPQNPEKWLRP